MIVEAEYEEIDGGEGELDLSADDSLPWLEADEDDDGAGEISAAQIMGFATLLLIALAAIVGAIWYFGGRASETAMVADGSVIEAPDTPYRERPAEPGGKQFDGTGNVAPVVGEGGTPDGVLDTDGKAADKPAEAAPAQAAQTKPAPTQTAPASGGVGVQLAAYSSRARAEEGWNQISRRTDALSGMRYRIEEGVVDIGKVYRLQAVAGDRAAADRLCSALKSDGIDCQVKP